MALLMGQQVRPYFQVGFILSVCLSDRPRVGLVTYITGTFSTVLFMEETVKRDAGHG